MLKWLIYSVDVVLMSQRWWDIQFGCQLSSQGPCFSGSAQLMTFPGATQIGTYQNRGLIINNMDLVCFDRV